MAKHGKRKISPVKKQRYVRNKEELSLPIIPAWIECDPEKPTSILNGIKPQYVITDELTDKGD